MNRSPFWRPWALIVDDALYSHLAFSIGPPRWNSALAVGRTSPCTQASIPQSVDGRARSARRDSGRITEGDDYCSRYPDAGDCQGRRV